MNIQNLNINSIFCPILLVAKNYELPKLLIREGSPIESFHSSDTQLETMSLRCDSPKIASTESTIDISNGAAPPESVQLNTVLTATADIMEPTALNDSNDLNTLLYDHGNGLEMSFHDATGEDASPLVSNNSSNNGSCELLHSTKSPLTQTNDFRTMFGSSPLLNYNPVTTTSRCLDNIPLKYRRGYSNLNDACLSSSTSNIKDILRTNRCTKESLRNAAKSTTNTNNIGASSGNSISQEIFSFLRNQNNAPADYVRSYENLDRTKIIRMKNEKRIMGNTNYGYAEGDLMPNYVNRSQISSTSSSSNNSQEWRYGKSYEDEMKEEDDSTDYSYSNLAYDNADMSGPPTFWNTTNGDTYQSDDSLFNINFDATDDDVFQIDSLNLLGVADSPLQSERNFFDDEDQSSHASELNNRLKNKTNKKSDAAEHGLLVPKIPNLLSLSDGNLLKVDSSKAQCDANKVVQTKGNRLTLNPICDLHTLKEPMKTREKTSKSEIVIPIGGGGVTTMTASIAPAASLASMTPAATSKASIKTVSSTAAVIAATATAPDPIKLPPTNPRCAQCNKKLGIIMVMKCHCEKMFCAKHRYAEAHNCSYDFKKEGQKTISKENPLVVATKVTKI